MIQLLKMHKVIVAMVGIVGAVQGFEIQEAEVNTERCGPGLELRGPDGALLVRAVPIFDLNHESAIW